MYIENKQLIDELESTNQKNISMLRYLHLMSGVNSESGSHSHFVYGSSSETLELFFFHPENEKEYMLYAARRRLLGGINETENWLMYDIKTFSDYVESFSN